MLVYASNAATRARVIRRSVSTRAWAGDRRRRDRARDEAAIARLDAGGIDLAILDGEAAPTGGMGLARQLKDELDDRRRCVLLVGRRDDAWLATWSRAEAVVSAPDRRRQLAEAVTSLIGACPTLAPAH